jgi:hypothetical protein
LKWLENLTVTKLFLVLVLLLIVTYMISPETAEWILTPIMATVEMGRDFVGGLE